MEAGSSDGGRFPDALSGVFLSGGRYRVDNPVSRSGSSFCFRGMDVYSGRNVTIREWFPADRAVRGSDGRQVSSRRGTEDRSIEAEASGIFREITGILSGLRSCRAFPGIIDCFTENGTVYTVFEPLDRFLSLEEYTDAAGGTLECEEAVRVILLAAEAALRLREVPALCRNITPDMLLLAPDGRVVFGDLFWIRKGVLSGEGQISLPKGKNLPEIPELGFAAPEAVTGRTVFAETAAVYSLSAVFYYLAAGIYPASSELRLKNDRLPALKELLPGLIPPAVSARIRRGMNPDPAKRPKTLDIWKKNLELAIGKAGDSGSSADEEENPEKPDEPGKPGREGRPGRSGRAAVFRTPVWDAEDRLVITKILVKAVTAGVLLAACLSVSRVF